MLHPNKLRHLWASMKPGYEDPQPVNLPQRITCPTCGAQRQVFVPVNVEFCSVHECAGCFNRRDDEETPG